MAEQQRSVYNRKALKPYWNNNFFNADPGQRWRRGKGCGASINSHQDKPLRILVDRTRYVEFPCGCRGHIGVDTYEVRPVAK